VYRQAGRHGDAMKTLQKGFVSAGRDEALDAAIS
jgi:hypothetical protein